MAKSNGSKKESGVTATTENMQRSLANLKPFKPGQSGNPVGRQKGSRNKLGEDFIQALQESFNQHGAETIEAVRVERPHEYLKVVASILPKELNVRTDALNEMSDDDLASMLDAVRSAVLAGATAQARDRSKETARH